MTVREIDLHITDARRNLAIGRGSLRLGEKHLHVTALLLSFSRIVASRTIDGVAVTLNDTELIVEIVTSRLHLVSQNLAKLFDIEALHDGLVIGLAQDLENNVIEEVALVHVLTHEHVLHSALTALHLLTLLMRTRQLGLGAIARKTAAEGRGADLAISALDRDLAADLDVRTRDLGALILELTEDLSLGIVVIFVKIALSLLTFELALRAEEGALDSLVELLLASIDNLVQIGELHHQETKECNRKNDTDEPNSLFFHPFVC